VDQEYIPEAWRTVTSEGDNLYKFLDPSKFPMEMVSEALQFWYERQEKGKVAFRFKSFLEGKGVWEAPPRKKIKVYTVGKGKRSKGPRKGQAETESRSDDEARPRNKGKPGRSTGQWKGQAETKSRSDDEVQSDDEDRVYTVGRGKLGSKGQGQRKGWAETESRLDDEAWSNGGLYSPPGIPPGIWLESRNSGGLITEFDILAESAWNIMGIVFILLCLVIPYRV